MRKIKQIESQVKGLLQDHCARDDLSHVDTMIEAIIDEIESDSEMSRSEIERNITGFDLIVENSDSNVVSFRKDDGWHLPIPHTCHKNLEFCIPWSDPDRPEVTRLCIEVSIPWPCPDKVKVD